MYLDELIEATGCKCEFPSEGIRKGSYMVTDADIILNGRRIACDAYVKLGGENKVNYSAVAITPRERADNRMLEDLIQDFMNRNPDTDGAKKYRFRNKVNVLETCIMAAWVILMIVFAVQLIIAIRNDEHIVIRVAQLIALQILPVINHYVTKMLLD